MKELRAKIVVSDNDEGMCGDSCVFLDFEECMLFNTSLEIVQLPEGMGCREVKSARCRQCLCITESEQPISSVSEAQQTVMSCRKCGHNAPEVRYHARYYNPAVIGGDDPPTCNRHDFMQCKEEHLHYYCQCGYQWVTPTLDNKEEPDEK